MGHDFSNGFDLASHGLLARPGRRGRVEEVHPLPLNLQYQLHPAARLPDGNSLAHEVVYHLFRGQLLLQQTDDPTGLFLLLQEVAITSTQQPVEKGHGPAASVLPISTATRQAPSAVFRQIVT